MGPAGVAANCCMTPVVNGGVMMAASTKRGAADDVAEEMELGRWVEEFISALRHHLRIESSPRCRLEGC